MHISRARLFAMLSYAIHGSGTQSANGCSKCSEKGCNTLVHHKTCSVTAHAQSHLMLRPRMAAKRKCSGTNKNAFFASCSSSSNAHVAVE